MEFECSTLRPWKEALSSYSSRIESLNKPDLVSLHDFYRCQLPPFLRRRNPSPLITTSELSDSCAGSSPAANGCTNLDIKLRNLRPRLLDFVSALDDSVVKSASEKAFRSLPDIAKAISELTVLKGVGPATASAGLAVYAPEAAPFMSDEAMVAALANSIDYTLKQYLLFAYKLQKKAKDLSIEGEIFTPSDVERALWSCAVGAKLSSQKVPDPKSDTSKNSKRKRKR